MDDATSGVDTDSESDLDDYQDTDEHHSDLSDLITKTGVARDLTLARFENVRQHRPSVQDSPDLDEDIEYFDCDPGGDDDMPDLQPDPEDLHDHEDWDHNEALLHHLDEGQTHDFPAWAGRDLREVLADIDCDLRIRLRMYA